MYQVHPSISCYVYATQDAKYDNHSYNDEPAYIESHERGCYYAYYDHGRWHRDDAPARIHSNNYQEWYNHNSRYEPKCQKL